MSEQWLSDTVIDESLPESLDNIIRKNREAGNLHLATREELAGLPGEIESVLPTKMHLADWSLITLRLTADGVSRNIVFALGYFGFPRRTVTTSEITAVDLEHGFIQTRNSVYSLDLSAAHVGEPDHEGLTMICAQLVAKGMGRHFGVPALFV